MENNELLFLVKLQMSQFMEAISKYQAEKHLGISTVSGRKVSHSPYIISRQIESLRANLQHLKKSI